VNRLRTRLDSGRTVLSVGEGNPLDPVVVDDNGNGQATEVDAHRHLGTEGSDE
jgi:hypothetical protein